LPVLTQIGETFAGRVAASLLKAAGLPELIVPTPQDYERLAVDLAASPEKLTAIRRKLAETRSRAPLFDTPLTTRHIERAYRAIHERFQAGLPPDHVYISPNQ
jgi:predicted O-linked N-acetylglucosamine transferase (SPINDLY family)